jgi:hypothetical protein
LRGLGAVEDGPGCRVFLERDATLPALSTTSGSDPGVMSPIRQPGRSRLGPGLPSRRTVSGLPLAEARPQNTRPTGGA